MNQKQRKAELARLIKSRFGTTRAAARFLSAVTGDVIYEQTLHKWKAPEGASTSRACPGWVLVILRDTQDQTDR